jgi:ATP-dependent protease HslVU (ClpYQ) peptidase subunit
MCHVTKIRQIGSSLYGFAGSVYPALVFLEWLGSGRLDKTRLYRMLSEDARDSVDILELSPDGLAIWNGWGVRLPIHDDSYAIGSGAMAALAALKSGAEPADALKQAFKLDECSGGDIEIAELVTPKKKRKRAPSRNS